MVGEFFINDKDAYYEWGLVFDPSAFTALLTPAPVKASVENKSALIHGKQVLSNEDNPPKVDERDLQLTFCLKAKNMTQFLARYESLVAEFECGRFDIRTKYQPKVTYRCRYVNCQSFSQFNGRLAKFVLKLNEPNPKNRK